MKKRAIALLLVLILAIGMTVTVFGDKDDPITPFTTDPPPPVECPEE